MWQKQTMKDPIDSKAPLENSSSVNELQTTLTRANEATHVAEEKLSLLINSVKDYGIFLLDEWGYIESWNIGAERIQGYKASEIVGKHFSTFYTNEDIQRQHPQYELQVASKEGRYEEEGWRVRKDGTKFWASITITPLRSKDGVLIGYAKVTRDLSERKEYEERLKASEERFRKMFEGVKDYAMIMLDPTGKVSNWNEGARRIKGYETDEIMGKYFSIFYPEEDVQMGKCEYELEEAKLTGRFEDEGWRVRKDGTKFWASVLITAIKSESGKLLGFSKVTRDITDRKRANDLLKMAYANLEKRIEARTGELIETNSRLEEAVQARDEFLSIASHELRTPLTPLKLQIQVFLNNIRRRDWDRLEESRIERMAETCERAISRLSSLVDNLLDVSRINAGKLNLNYESLELTELAQEILERFRAEIQRSQSTVTLEAPALIQGSFDRLRIEQVFVNLLTNALKYGKQKPVHISLTQQYNWIIIEFQDQGIGIAEKDQKKIFQRFERAVDESNIGGMGLGLYITNQIVQAHGGEISVRSLPGEGTTFTVKIPSRV